MLDLVTILRWGASLCWALAAGRLLLSTLSREPEGKGRWGVAALILAGAALTALGLPASARDLDPVNTWSTAAVLATETWGGRMAMLRVGLAIAASLVVWLRGLWGAGAALLVLCTALFLIPFSGHAVTAEPIVPSLILHGIHVCTVLVWAGGVMNLAVLVLWPRVARNGILPVLAAFSPFALALVMTGIVSGLAAGYLQAGAGAALFGTFYGRLLLLKCLLLAGVALPCAAWLRWRFLPNGSTKSPRLALADEAAACLCLIGIASILSQSVPARHDEIIWPLPFRLDFSVLNPDRDGAYVLQGHLIFGAVMLAVAAVGAVLRNGMLLLLAGSMGLLIGGLGVLNMAVPAYPTTFAAFQSSYSVETLSAAEPVYLDKCAPCHGATGRGDGPEMVKQGKRAADLTVHASMHTPGDIYWWITNGISGTAMPGFESVIPEQQRWDLVNYLKLISYGARSASVTGEPAAEKPLLPSMDFRFVDRDGNEARLRDLEGRNPVLLVIGANGSADRFEQLLAADAAFAGAGVRVVFAAPEQIRQQLPTGTGDSGSWVPESDVLALSTTWRHYLGLPSPGSSYHMEFLVDRFGYVRAKWQGDPGQLPAPSVILSSATTLQSEGKLLPSPEEHVH